MDLKILFSAKRFAVVGASADPTKVGHQLLRNLAQNSELTLYPINLKGGQILDLPVYSHLYDTPEPAEIVVVCVPVQAVEEVVDECIRISAKAVVLITSGFAEVGGTGTAIQARLVAKLHAAGVTLLGPNSMGYLAPAEQIFATFGPSDISSGPIAVISQSGAMLSALFQEYVSSGTGISFALSLGNRTGISENDALAYALADPHTKVVVIYLESVADPQILLGLAKQLSLTKPIFLLKGGVTQAGRSAAVSHTAALATSQVLLSELCYQAGIVELANFEQLVRASIAAAKTSYLPESVAIITNAGGPAVVLTDEIVGAELTVSPPTDLLGDATAGDYAEALSQHSFNLAVDALVVIVTEQAVTDMQGITRVLLKPWSKRLLFACLAGGDQLDPFRAQLKAGGVIVTRYPNEIAETLGALARAKKRLGIKLEQAFAPTRPLNDYPSTYAALTSLLAKYNLASPLEIITSDEKELTQLKDLIWPLIAKTTNLSLLHKAKLGAVIPDIINQDQAIAAYHHLLQWGREVVFQQKIKSGVEVLLGAHQDSFWGWYLAVGIGGSLTNTYDDRAYIFLPATETELDNALNRTKLVTLLSPDARNELLTAIWNLQKCVLSTQHLTELEINPLFVDGSGVVAADLKRA